jgi:hypothetical protein
MVTGTFDYEVFMDRHYRRGRETWSLNLVRAVEAPLLIFIVVAAFAALGGWF